MSATGLAMAVAAALADPAALAPPPSSLREAQALAARLADPSFAAREAASAGLARLGRAALPALVGAARDPSAEVRGRAAVLRPAAAEADRALRIASFLADRAGRYRHDVPGYGAFVAAAGDTPGTKTLYAAAAADPANARLVKGLDSGAEPLFAALVARREELSRLYARPASGQASAPPVPAVALLMAAEVVTRSETPPPPTREYGVGAFLGSAEGLKALVGEGEHGPAMGRLARRWLSTRTSATGVVQALQAANAVDPTGRPGRGPPPADPLPPELTVELAARVFARRDVQLSSRATTAYLVLMRHRCAGQLTALAGPLADESEVTQSAGVDSPAILIRDLALAAALVATGQKPADYGYTDRSLLGQLTYRTYTFRDDPPAQKGAADAGAKRKAAFAKWAAWRAATRGGLGGALLAASPDALAPPG